MEPLEESKSARIKGRRDRGLVQHCLFEEVLNGKVREPELESRPAELTGHLGLTMESDPAKGLVPGEFAGSVTGALSLPDIVGVRDRLVPEFPDKASTRTGGGTTAKHETADAGAFDGDGRQELIIDRNSDEDPCAKILECNREQVGADLRMTGTKEGMIVLATSGTVLT